LPIHYFDEIQMMIFQTLSIQRWTRYHAFVIFTTFLAAIALKTVLPLAVAGLLSFVYLIWQHQAIECERGLLYFWQIPANWVTFIRVIVICVVGVNYQHLSPFLIGVFGLVILLSDKLDGYLAQKYKTTSVVGAQFDQETDAFFISVYSLILYLDDYLGIWVLMLGLLRYINILALVLLKQQHKKEPRLLVARLVATMVMIALLIPFFTPKWLYTPYVAFSVFCLVLSFAYTFSYQVLQPE